MEYKKIIKDNIKYHLIKTDRFKGINITLFLTKEFNKKDIPFLNMLIHNITYSSKKYNSKEKIASVSEDLYGLSLTSSFTLTGGCETLSFSLDFLNPKYTEEKYLDLSLDYFKEIVFNPNIKYNKFNSEYFNIVKNDLISSINAIKDNPNKYAGINYAKIMYDGTPTAYNTVPTIEDLNSVNEEKLYSFYKSIFNNKCNADICILGEVDESIVDKIHNKVSTIKPLNKKLSFTINHKYKNKVIEQIDALKYNQSKLYIGYRLHNMNYHELMHVLRVYNTILGTMNDSILFNIVREENSLCYSIGSYINRFNPSLTVYAGINKENYDKTIELIKKCVELMQDKKSVKRLFESAKKTINTFLNNYYDDSVMQINNYYVGEYETVEDIETLRDNINKVTIEEVLELNKKISLSTIYMLKGDN